MTKPLNGTRFKTSNTVSCEKSSITVERSFGQSVEYAIMEPGRQLGQAGSSEEESRRRAVLTANTISSAKVLAGRPSTARPSTTCGKRTAAPVQDNPPCSNSEERSSQGNVGLHEALRSQVLHFRQSRRWAKAYLPRDDKTKQSTRSNSLSLKKTHTSTYDIPQHPSAANAVDATGTSDDEQSHYGLCGTPQISGWKLIRKRRFPRNCSTTTKVGKSAGAKILKGRKPIKSIRARFQTDSRRAVLPKTVRSNARLQNKQQPHLAETPRRWRRHRRQNNSQHSLISVLSGDVRQSNRERSSSPVSSLRDYEKITRFSQECVDMLSGLDFGDEWRVSVVAPALSIPQKPSAELPNVDVTDLVDQDHRTLDVTTSTAAPRTASGTSRPPSHISTKTSDAPKHNDSSQASQFTCAPFNTTLGGMTTVSIDEVDDKAEGLSSHHKHAVKAKSSTSSFNEHIGQNLTKDLKNARSVDTLTKIEAQVDNAASTHRLQKKSSSFTLTSTPKHQMPSSGPPERPLPDLPKDDIREARSTVHRQASSASSCRSRTIHDTLEIADPFKTSSVQTITHLPSPDLSSRGAPIFEGLPSRLVTRPSNSSLNSAKFMPGSNLASVQEQKHLSGNAATPIALKVKGVASERFSKVQQVKKRHIAYWTKSNDEAGKTACGTNYSYVEPESRKPGLPNVVGQTGMQETPGLHSGTDKILSKNTILYIDGVPIPSFAIQLPEKRPSVSTEHETSQELVRPTSKASSATSRRVQNRYRKLQTATSITNLRQRSDQMRKNEQALGRSQIMVVVDTNPHTYSFRAGALSPSPSVKSFDGKPKISACNQASRVPSKPASASKRVHDHTLPTEIDNSAEPVDVVKPPASVRERRSSRELRSHSSAQNPTLDFAKQTSEYVLPMMRSSRSRSKIAYHRIAESSDSELGDSPLLKQSQSSKSTYVRNHSRTSTRKSHRRKDTPLTAILKEEVRKADLERENLKKYEQRIENLQLHLEQTLKVWDRMSQHGKKQYLVSAVGADDKKNSTKLRARPNQYETVSAASSMYSRRSSIHKLDEKVSRSLKDALAQQISNGYRRTSRTSTTTRTCTDTDTDESTDNTYGSGEKRTSGGSLTDPHEYDLSLPSQQPIVSGTNCEDFTKETKAKLSSTNLDDLCVRLRANRHTTVPVREWRLHTPTQRISSPDDEPKTVSNSPSNRFAIAPWEVHDETAKRMVDEENASFDSDSDGIDRLNLQQETLRTDQMDAMLGL